MRQDLNKRIVGHLSRGAFTEFVIELFNDGASAGGEMRPFGPLDLDDRLARPPSELLDGLLCQPFLDSYGGSVHSVYILYYCPLELATNPRSLDLSDPYLQDRLRLVQEQYDGRIGRFGMVDPYLVEANALNALGLLTNLVGFDTEEYKGGLLKRFMEELRRIGIAPDTALLGSYDSFFELNPEGVQAAFERFVTKHRDGLRISLHGDEVQVSSFVNERNFSGLLTGKANFPYEPVLVTEEVYEGPVIKKFQELLRSSASEKELEEFLAAHYREVFGCRYDRIERQLWLRFPDVDIAGHNRRLDLFLRNSVTSDWEIFELKRPGIRLTGTYRDVPSLTSEISNALQQLRNYGRILDQREVRSSLANAGIEYFEPELNLVVGRGPEIPQRQWRWLQRSAPEGIRLITYEELLREMEARIKDRLSFKAGNESL